MSQTGGNLRSKVEVGGRGASKEEVWWDREHIALKGMSAARQGQKGQEPSLKG